MMTPELNHPWFGCGGRAQNRDIVFGTSEFDAISSKLKPSALPFEGLIAIHDVDHFLITRWTQRGRHKCERGFLLSSRHIAKLYTVAFGSAVLERDAGW